MKNLRLLLSLLPIIAITACVDGTPTTQSTDCGPLPSRGSYTVIYEDRNGSQVAVLSRTDFNALVSERAALKQWGLCISGMDQ